MREQFITKTMSPARLAVVEKANEISTEYRGMGFSLTLRQLCYQFVARGLIPNRVQEYKRLGDIINDARLLGLFDWDAIEDRTRNVKSVTAWTSPQSILNAVAEQYKERVWDDQPCHVEVWIEKDALTGIIEPICTELRLPYLACRGYLSQSEQYAAGKRFANLRRRGKQIVVMHLGDHDPSGMDMTRDNQARLSMFARHDVEVRRLALNMNQVEEYDPPPNPAKESDSRATGYMAEFGDSSWELDALDPPLIAQLIRDEVDTVLDTDAWEAAMEGERVNRETLEGVAAKWDEVQSFLGQDYDED